MKSTSGVVFLLVVSLTVFGPRISRGKVLPKRVDLLSDRVASDTIDEREHKRNEGCPGPSGKMFPFGKKLVVGDCKQLCVCTKEGFFDCRPLCTHYFDMHCPAGLHSHTYAVRAGPQEFGCKCTEYKCV